jgi:hypothetical protein
VLKTGFISPTPQVGPGGKRLVVSAALALGGLLLLELAFPGFHLGPALAMDPQLYEVWFARLGQSQSVLRLDVQDGPEYAAVTFAMLALAVPALMGWRRHSSGAQRTSIEFLLFSVLVTTLAFRRGSYFLVVFYALPLGFVGDAIWQWRLRTNELTPGLARRLSSVIAVEGFLFVAAMTPHVAISAVALRGPATQPESGPSEDENCRRSPGRSPALPNSRLGTSNAI